MAAFWIGFDSCFELGDRISVVFIEDFYGGCQPMVETFVKRIERADAVFVFGVVPFSNHHRTIPIRCECPTILWIWTICKDDDVLYAL